MLIDRHRRSEEVYRDRWRHDKVVRSTHGVNCTGSCSWNVYVKDGLITWETQATDYPRTDPARPDHEPRGCPRGASFSWYTYSPARLKHPLVRGSLLERWRAARASGTDPVEAWAQIAADGAHKSERGRGGFVRATWDEVTELTAAATVHTIKAHGPDRVTGFTPIPAMSPVSFAAGSRFLGLIGAGMLSFYDWYADLPPASPQVFGDQTDVPESADWWDASYLVIWGTNLPITRTPDAHFMTEARYRGQKVVVVSPDYSDHVKFADDWLAAQPGTDGALAMAMGHVILNEFWVERRVPRFEEYARRYSDLPLLVTLRERDGAYVPDRFLTAADVGEASENAQSKTCVLDAASGRPAVPNGSAGFRWGEEGEGRWNLRLDGIEPVLSLLERPGAEAVAVDMPRFDIGDTEGGGVMRRGVPAMRVGDTLVTTVLDLMLATYGVGRAGLPGDWPSGYDDPSLPYTPAWQEPITGVGRQMAVKVAREFARNAEVSGGRSMICMGAGTNHWFHSDETYRAFIAMLVMCGCIGVNGGGWAHYVGQEKIRTFAGWQAVAGGMDWRRPPRQGQGTSWYYTHTEQWRYDRFRLEQFASPLGRGLFAGQTALDAHAKAVRLGWMPGLPRSPATRSTWPTRPRRPAPTRSTTWSISSGAATCASPSTTPASRPAGRACSSSGARTCWGRRARARSTSCATCSAPRRTRSWPTRADGHDDEAPRGQARPAGERGLPHDHHRDLLRCRAAGRHLVREVRPVDDRHAPVRALLQPGSAAAVGVPFGLGRVQGDRGAVLGAGRRPPRHPP